MGGWENPFDLMSVLKDFGHVERITSGGLWELGIGKVITSDIRKEDMDNTKKVPLVKCSDWKSSWL